MEKATSISLDTQSQETLLETKRKILSETPGTKPGMETVIVEAVVDLLDGLGSGNVSAVEGALCRLGVRKEHDLYHHVGQMARSLHNALTEFKQSLEHENISMTSTTIPDAADKLEAVIGMTFEAAERTLDLVDKQNSTIQETDKQLDALQQWISRNTSLDLAAAAFLYDFLNGARDRNRRMEEATTQILMAQEFQDLTGQALKKVVRLVTGIEEQLISLITLFGFQSEASEEKQAEPENKENKDVRLDQDETDALLASLGF